MRPFSTMKPYLYVITAKEKKGTQKNLVIYKGDEMSLLKYDLPNVPSFVQCQGVVYASN